MREISRALQTALARSSDWSETLSTRLEKLKGIMDNPACAHNAQEVAQIFEHCVADREGAIAGYVLCYRADSQRVDALARAQTICVEVGDFATTARLSRLQYKNDPNPWHLANEGIAWLDAGQPDRAVKPLMAAARHLPESDSVQSALRTARREWPSVRQEVARLMQKADAAETYEEASDSVLQAARMLRMLQTNQVSLEKLLLASLKHDPENVSALGLLEQRLSHVENKDALLEVYDARLASRETDRERVEELRRAGMRVYLHPAYRALGVRLVHRALQIAYKKQLADIPGHLAMIAILRRHYEQAGDVGKALEIIEQALDGPLPEIDLQYLALQGLDLTMNVLDDEKSARTYADLASGFMPENPLVKKARELRLTGQSDLSLPLAMPATGSDDTLLLDDLELAPPPPLVGQPAPLSEQLSAAAKAGHEENFTDSQFSPTSAADDLPETLDLEALPDMAPEQSAARAGLSAAEAPPLDLVEPEAAEAPPLDFVELPAAEAPPLDLVEPAPEVADPLEFVELPGDEDNALEFVEMPGDEDNALEFVEMPGDEDNALEFVEMPGDEDNALELLDVPQTAPPPQETALPKVPPSRKAPAAKPATIPKPEPKPKPAPAASSVTAAKPKPKPAARLVTGPKPKPAATTAPKAKPAAKPATTPKPKPAARLVTGPKPKPAAKPATTPKPKPAARLVTAPKPGPEAKPTTAPKSKSAAKEPAPKSKSAAKEPAAKPPSAAKEPAAKPPSAAKTLAPKPKPAAKPATAPKPKLAAKPATAPKPKPAAKPATAPKPKLAAKPATAPKPKLAAKPATAPKPPSAAKTPKPKLAAKPATAPKPKPAAKPATAPKPKQPAVGAPAKATLGKISLIPKSAMSALKKAGGERKKSPANAIPRSPRLVMPIRVEFSLADSPCSALTRELSITGAFLITNLKFPPDLALELAIQMPISCDSMRSETMLMKARVVHAADTGCGVVFDNPSDEFKTRLNELIAQQ